MGDKEERWLREALSLPPEEPPRDWREEPPAPAPVEPAPRRSPPRPFPGQDLLSGATASEILERICDGDPLHVATRVEAVLTTKAVLVDPDWLLHRALARIAFAANTYEGIPPLQEWIDGRILVAIDDLKNDDREEERKGLPPDTPLEPRFDVMVRILGVEPGLSRKAVVTFNDLPLEARSAFYAVVIERKTINRYVAEGFGPPSRVIDLLTKGLEAISRIAGGPIDLDRDVWFEE